MIKTTSSDLCSSDLEAIDSDTASVHKTLLYRILVVIPALTLLVSVIWFHGLYAKVVTVLVGLLCINEMMNMVSGKACPVRIAGYLFAVLLCPCYVYLGGLTGVAMLLTFCVMAVFTVLLISRRNLMDGLFTIFPMVYPGLFFGSILGIVCISDLQASQFLLIIIFSSAILTDTFAYLGGMLFGRHKLAETISPKKTVEGAIVGTVLGTIGLAVVGALAQKIFGFHIYVWWYLPLGLLLSVLAQAGDLAASFIKRFFGIKDFGRIMGPHGGALDRLDSVLFIAPAVYAFYTIVGV